MRADDGLILTDVLIKLAMLFFAAFQQGRGFGRCANDRGSAEDDRSGHKGGEVGTPRRPVSHPLECFVPPATVPRQPRSSLPLSVASPGRLVHSRRNMEASGKTIGGWGYKTLDKVVALKPAAPKPQR